jgi:hypothetical protein
VVTSRETWRNLEASDSAKVLGLRSNVGVPEEDSEVVREIARSSFSADRGEFGLLKEELDTLRECEGRSKVGDEGTEDFGALTSLKI